MCDFINKQLNKPKTHWQWFKDFFQITYFRYLVTWFAIVPVLANFFKHIPTSFKIDTINSRIEYCFNLDLPFDWKLLWISSLFFVTAFALYKIFCPSFIKKYNSYNEYLTMKHSPRWIIWESSHIFKKKMDLDKFVDRLSTKKYIELLNSKDFEAKKDAYNLRADKKKEKFDDFGVIVEEKKTSLYFKFKEDNYCLSLPIIINNQENIEETLIVEKELFWEVFGRYSASYPKIRLLILILLFASGVLFLIVLFENIYTGFKYFF